MDESKIIKIAKLIEYLSNEDEPSFEKAATVNIEVKNGLISAQEGIELLGRYT